MQRFAREYSITVDEYGIDPLLDKQFSKIQDIAYYKEYTISLHEVGAPDLIALAHYGNQDYWWHFMVYNSISRISQLVEGLTLRMPEASEILKVSSSNNNSNGSPVLVDRLIEI